MGGCQRCSRTLLCTARPGGWPSGVEPGLCDCCPILPDRPLPPGPGSRSTAGLARRARLLLAGPGISGWCALCRGGRDAVFGELPAWPASPGLAVALKAGCGWLTTAHRHCLPPAGRMPGGLASDRGGPHVSQHGGKLPREELGLGATVGAREQHWQRGLGFSGPSVGSSFAPASERAGFYWSLWTSALLL